MLLRVIVRSFLTRVHDLVLDSKRDSFVVVVNAVAFEAPLNVGAQFLDMIEPCLSVRNLSVGSQLVLVRFVIGHQV